MPVKRSNVVVTATSSNQIQTRLSASERLKEPKAFDCAGHSQFIAAEASKDHRPHEGGSIKPLYAFNCVVSSFILGGEGPSPSFDRMKEYYGRCIAANGGVFGGSLLDAPHAAFMYTSLAVLVHLRDREALRRVDREAVYRFYLSLKTEGGAFRMTEGGEADLRAVYSVLAGASLLGVLRPELARGVAGYVASCQAYEGGFGSVPGCEAHGGYSFCAMASLLLLGEPYRVDLPALLVFRFFT